MTQRNKILLHIGLPKTATTAFQVACLQGDAVLAAQGTAFYTSILDKPRPVALEMTLATMRPGFECMASADPNRVVPPDLADRIRREIVSIFQRPGISRVIVSDENLCFLRHPDELENLRRLFPAGVDIEVFLMLRDRRSWRESYATELAFGRHFRISKDPESAFCLAPGSWIFDFDRIERDWRRAFGTLHVLHSDPEHALPALMGAMGLRMPAPALSLRVNQSG